MLPSENGVYISYYQSDLLKSLPQRMKTHAIPGLSLALINIDQITNFECGVKNNLSQVPIQIGGKFTAYNRNNGRWIAKSLGEF